MKQKTTKDRIINWARWARGGPAKLGASMTGLICDRMREAALGAGAATAASSNPLDSADAAVVERVWKGLQPKHRELLRWHYIRQARPELICRRMGIKPRPASIFDIELARAEAALGTALLDANVRFHPSDAR